MKIIGINNEMYISSACLMVDGEIVAAVADERITRKKLSKEFPHSAIQSCLDIGGIKLSEVDYFATSWNPSLYFKKYNPIYSGKRRHMVETFFSVPDNLLKNSGFHENDYCYTEVPYENHNLKIYHITHHRAHSANALYLSPYNEAAILTADAQGEFESTTINYGKDNKINKLSSIDYPHSLGAFYGTITEFLGFQSNSDEWKVMALASYGKKNNSYYKKMKENMFLIKEQGKFELNLNYFNGYMHDSPELYTNRMIALFGQPRKKNDPIQDRHYEIAAALQQATEEITYNLLDYIYKETNTENLCLSGGYFMNSVLNGKVQEKSNFKNLFISSCPDDSGNCFGAAYYLYYDILKNKRKITPMIHNYYGPEFDNKEIEKILESLKINSVLVSEPEKVAAKMISEGKIIGWFQGKMEFGQRALGNRSILADPRDPSMKDKINAAIKYRESFRPFAPAILEEYKDEYFEMGDIKEVPFMEKVCMIKPDSRKVIPAVTHVDGSGRLQTVSKKTNTLFYGLIKEFYNITGVPIVLNTSLNLNGEPIVCSPNDALKTFISCGMDAVFIGNYLVEK